jgi:DNA-binding PadR family transcriptional regulator
MAPTGDDLAVEDAEGDAGRHAEPLDEARADGQLNLALERQRHTSTAFELFILGELMDGPHHGYLLRDILARLLGPYRQISWAAIYPLIHRLEREGLIAPERVAAPAPPQPERKPGGATLTGRQRRIFGITEAGRERFFALTRAPGVPTAGYRELFAIKLNYLRFLAPKEQRAIVAECAGYLERQRDHLRHVFTAQSTTARLPPEQREQIFRMMRFRLASVEAELRWAQEELARLGERGDVGDAQARARRKEREAASGESRSPEET